jgi:Family of unknown function (DUF6084)
VTSLSFEVVGARPEPFAVEPTLLLELRILEADGRPVHAVALRCQIRIEPQRRRYDPVAEEGMVELFGETSRWGESLRPFLWTHVATVVPSFTGSTVVDLPVTCTYDFEVASTKYLHALGDGVVPLALCFSGTAFTADGSGFRATPVSWDQDAVFDLPISVWRTTMDRYFPDSGWIRVQRSTLDRVSRFRAERALPTWDLTLEQLLKEAGAAP